MSQDFERVFQVGQRVEIFGGSTHVGKAGKVHNETRCKVRVCLDETKKVALKDKKYVRPEVDGNNNGFPSNENMMSDHSNDDENMLKEAVGNEERVVEETEAAQVPEEGSKDVTISFGEIGVTDDNKVGLFAAFKVAVQSNLQVAPDEQVFDGEPLFLSSGTVLVRFLDTQNASKIVGNSPITIGFAGEEHDCHVGFRSGGPSDFSNFDGGNRARDGQHRNESCQNILLSLSPPSYRTRAGPWDDEPQDRASKRPRRGW